LAGIEIRATTVPETVAEEEDKAVQAQELLFFKGNQKLSCAAPLPSPALTHSQFE